MLAAQCDVIEQLDAEHETHFMHSPIRLVTDRKRARTREEISSWRKRRYYRCGTNVLSSIMTTEVIWQNRC